MVMMKLPPSAYRARAVQPGALQMPLPRRHTTLLDLDATGDGTLRIFAPPDDPATKAAAYRPNRWLCHANLWDLPARILPL